MASKLFFLPGRSAINLKGFVAPGAEIYFYQTGGTTKLPVYANDTLTTELTNPVPANGAGRFPAIYINDALTYRVKCVDVESGDILFDVDPYVPGNAAERGDVGPPGTLGNNSGGIVSTLAANTSGHRFNVINNAMPFQVFGTNELNFELMRIDGSGAFLSRKFMIISGINSDTDTSPAGQAARLLPNYKSTFWGSSWQSSMIQVYSDVSGPTVQVRQGYAPNVGMSFVGRLGEENFVIVGNDACGGELRFSALGEGPIVEDHVTNPGLGGGFGAITADEHKTRLRGFYDGSRRGVVLFAKDAVADGPAVLALGPNGALSGFGPGVDAEGFPTGTSYNLVQIEIGGGAVARYGDPALATVINGDTVSTEKPIKLPVYTVAGLPGAGTHVGGRAFVNDANSTTFMATVAGGGANFVPVFSDGTNWKIG